MKKLMIATAAGVVAAGAFAEAEVWNLTFNAKCLVPSYTKAGEVDYYKQGSVKYTAMQVNGDTYAWDSKNFYGDATISINDTDTFGKKDEKVCTELSFDVDGNSFTCAGFGTEKSVSGSFVGSVEDAAAYGTWSVKVNASAAKKLDANPELTLTDLVKLPKAVLESKKDWDALQDAIESQVKGATTLAELMKSAEAGVAEAEAEMLAVTNKIAALEDEIEGLDKALVDYQDNWDKMVEAIAIPVGKVYEKSTTVSNTIAKAEAAYTDTTNVLAKFETKLDELNTALQALKGLTSTELKDKYLEFVEVDGKKLSRTEQWEAEIAEDEAEIKAQEDLITAQNKDIEKAKADLDAALAIFDTATNHFATLAGKQIATEDPVYTAENQYADAVAEKNKAVKEQQDAINAYSAPVKLSEKMDLPIEGGMTNGSTVVNLGGALTEAKLMLNGYNNDGAERAYFFEDGFYWQYEIVGAKAKVVAAEEFVTEIKNAQELVKKAPDADKADLEKAWVDSLKKQFLED